ncbi:autotransporter domain-containing protein, partial [Sphingopyxis sp. BSNA05]|uniref:autotransporter outer membrane beta-barrel domain-containing protein n=1 Tax=Sphingopyxis sp. BSNA05 TaxID=1236614 RepID=UPI0015662574
MTSGANSDAVFTGSVLEGSVTNTTFTNSRFATSGDDSRAFIAEAIGQGSVASLAIADSDFITEGANSTAIIFNEGSVFSAIGPADSSISSFNISESTISTLGDNSLGIDVATLAGDNSTTVIAMSSNQISTAGANSDAISIGTQAALGRDGASHTVSIDLSTIETSGDDSRGIYIGSLVDGLGGANATNGGVTNATIFSGDNVIVTTGARSHGLEYATITGDLEDGIVDIVAGNSTIQTRGDNAIGMLFGGVEGAFIDSTATDRRPQLSMMFAPLSIATEGDGSHGIQIGDLPAFNVADSADVTLTLLTRTITTTGDGAHGVVIGSGWGEANSTRDPDRMGSNRTAILTVDGIIDVSGAGSHGIVSDSIFFELSVSETGRVTSADGFALKFDTVDDGFTAFNLGEIDGDVIFGDGDDTLDSSGTITGNIDMGAGANAILIRSGGLFNSLDSVLLGAGNAITVEGDIAPGGVGPIQVTNIGSDLVFAAGSQFLVDIDGMAADTNAAGFFQSDRITVDGDITINGGTLVVESLTPEGDFDRQAQFLILDAAGTVTGEFADLMADLPFLDLSLTYKADSVILNAGRQGPVVPFASLGLTPNQRAVGASFDALEPNAMGDLDDVIDQLIFASTDQALTAFDTASGEIYASLLAQAGKDGLRRSRETLARARSAANSGWGIWGGIGSSDSSTDGDGNGAAVDQNDFGFYIGIDYVGEDNAWAAGVSTGWRDGSLDVSDRLSTAEYDTWYLAGHARYGTGGQGATVTAALDISEIDAGVERTLTVNGINRDAQGNADVDTFAIGGEARYGVSISEDWAIGPVVSVIHTDSDLSLDNETGAGSVALSSADASDGQT